MKQKAEPKKNIGSGEKTPFFRLEEDLVIDELQMPDVFFRKEDLQPIAFDEQQPDTEQSEDRENQTETKEEEGKVRGFFKRIGRGFKRIGKAIAGGARKVKRGLKKAAKWLWTGTKYVSRQLWEKIKGIAHRAKRWITSLPVRLKRLVVHLWKGVKSLEPWSLEWWKSLGKADTWKSFGKWLGELAIYAVEISGLPEIYETLADFIKFNTRPLSGDEKEMARGVFGESIDYELVRVDEKAILGPSWTNRPYVSFHTINSWGPMSPDTLIHELTHVWQYEKMGAMYMPRALHGNNKPGFYDYGGLDALEANKEKGMDAFNVEEQGEIMADYYRIKNDMDPEYSTGTKDNLAIYEVYVNEVKAK